MFKILRMILLFNSLLVLGQQSGSRADARWYSKENKKIALHLSKGADKFETTYIVDELIKGFRNTNATKSKTYDIKVYYSTNDENKPEKNPNSYITFYCYGRKYESNGYNAFTLKTSWNEIPRVVDFYENVILEKNATSYYDKKDYSNALKSYKILASRGSTDAMFQIGKIYSEIGDIENAIIWFEKNIKNSPNGENYYTRYALGIRMHASLNKVNQQRKEELITLGTANILLACDNGIKNACEYLRKMRN